MALLRYVYGMVDHEPKISPLMRKWMPGATDEELIEATANWRRYLDVLYDIYKRLEAERKFPLTRAKDNEENEA